MCLLFSILYSRCDLCATAPCGFQAHTSSILINVQFLFVHYEAFLSSTKLRTIILTSSSDNPILVLSSLYTSVFLYDGRRPVKLKNPSKPVFSTVPEGFVVIFGRMLSDRKRPLYRRSLPPEIKASYIATKS